ncbi:glycosyltransferase [Niastella caeni]|uniref:Glycosyltransferase n=1 Tax=Niastella caeni TaxID=2569763 RepID=A0A4S8I211_9BACT|nr:glycosyltransferase [Niastella caeni]THU41781.1 glycosyltransferase [Niastella caeni]
MMPLFFFLFFLLMVVYAVLIAYYHKAWNKMPAFVLPEKQASVFISVIIAARNEEKNIQNLLQSLNDQRYPKALYEVIIIDDHSTDNTWSLLQELHFEQLQIRPLQLKDHIAETNTIASYKKKAIETGINAATGTLIVTTDADCRFNPLWLQTIAAFYEANEAKFIAAPVTYYNQSSLLSVFQTLDFLTLQGITAASVYKRFHSMCNGANLAYERSAFYEVNGFNNIDTIASGDDMLLMHKIFKQYPDKVYYLKNRWAIVTTEPAANWKQFFNQRIRWASKADRYDDKRIFLVLLLVYLLNVCFLAGAIAAFFKYTWLMLVLLLLLAKVLIEFPFVNSVAIFFGQQKLMKYFPFLQPLHIGYTIIAGWLGKFGHYEWKGRRIKK